MKKVLFIFIIILLAVGVSAEWRYTGNSLSRQYIQTQGEFVPQNLSSYNLTCGAGGEYNYIEPLLDTWGDNDTKPDLFLSCAADSINSNPHILMISDDLEYLDIQTLSSEVTGGVGSFRAPASWADLDDDGNTEFIILNVKDGYGTKSVSILIYTFNKTSGLFQSYGEQILWDNTNEINIITTPYNYTGHIADSGHANDQYGIDCFDDGDYCIVYGYGVIFRTDISTDYRVEWLLDFNGETVTSSTATDQLRPAYEGSDYVWRFNATSGGKRISTDNGTIMANYTFATIAGSPNTMEVVNCDGGACETGYEILTAETYLSKGYAELFSIKDGDLLHRTRTDAGDSTSSGSYAWIEDRDADGIDEICALVFDELANGGDDQGAVRCEEPTLFAPDTLDEILTINTLEDTTATARPVITDIDGDGLYDIIIGKNVYLLDSSVTYYVMLNDTIPGTMNLQTVVSRFDESDTATLFSWIPTADNDNIVMSTSAALPTEPNLTGFVAFDEGPVQLINNPVCQGEYLEFRCTYGNACAVDGIEYDNFGLYVDCYGDGSETYFMTSGEMFLNYDIIACDLDNTNLTGVVNATFTIFEGIDPTINDTFNLSYIIDADNASCYTEEEPGVITEPVTNLPPVFTGIPGSDTPQPFCRDATIVFNCSSPDCYEDEEGDRVYFAVDCEGDGVYEKTSSYGTDTFYCKLNYTVAENGSQQINIEVADSLHSSDLDSLGFSVTISPYTQGDALATGDAICASPTFYIDGEIVMPGVDEPGSPTNNALYKMYKAVGDIGGVSVSLISWLVIIISTVLVGYAGYSVGSSMAITGGMLTFAAMSVIHALMGLIGWTVVIVMVVVALGFGVYRFAGGQPAGG